MSAPGDSSAAKASPPLADLLADYLRRQTAAEHAGLAPADRVGEVVPFETAPVQPVDPRIAWDGALTALRLYQPAGDASPLSPPAGWPALVASPEPLTAVPLCVGNFPQLVRNFHVLLRPAEWSVPRPGRAAPVPGLAEWAEEAGSSPSLPLALLALGCLRLSGQFDAADRLVRSRAVPPEWQPAWTNERAALAWHRGRTQEADELWSREPAGTPTRFNRGMAALFTGRPADAGSWLNRAVGEIAEEDPWHHLGRLYLALAQTHG